MSAAFCFRLMVAMTGAPHLGQIRAWSRRVFIGGCGVGFNDPDWNKRFSPISNSMKWRMDKTPVPLS